MPLPLPWLGQVPDERIFDVCANIVFIPWLILVISPKSGMRRTVVFSVVILECVVYVAFFVTSFQGNGSDAAQTFADMGTLDGVKKLFANDDVILPAWVHYLAFDLIVGNHLVERNLADPAGLHQLLMFPVLLLTLMAGPMGFLVYTVMKTVQSGVSRKPAVKIS